MESEILESAIRDLERSHEDLKIVDFSKKSAQNVGIMLEYLRVSATLTDFECPENIQNWST